MNEDQPSPSSSQQSHKLSSDEPITVTNVKASSLDTEPVRERGGKRTAKDDSLLEKINLPKFMLTRTELCRHKHGCLENTLRGWYRSFAFAFLIKSLVTHLPKILRPAKLIRDM